MTEYKFHPVSNLFPLISDDELRVLADDIKERGLQEPIWLHPDDQTIIDGRNRYLACRLIDVEPETRTWGKRGSLVSFVWGLNGLRRHLTSSQKATIAVEMLPILEQEAKDRQREHGKTAPGKKSLSQKIDEVKGKASEQAAAITGTNRQYVSDAKTIKEKAPEVYERVRAGEISIPEAKREVSGKPHVARNSGENEWYTPKKYIDAAVKVMGGIDLDPASSATANKIIGASKFYSRDDDGIQHEWCGRVRMNPPYSSDLIGEFTCKFIEEYGGVRISEGIVLVNNATETKWFADLVASASAIVFPTGRVKFLDSSGNPTGAPLQGQAFLYFGKNDERFMDVFGEFGWGATL